MLHCKVHISPIAYTIKNYVIECVFSCNLHCKLVKKGMLCSCMFGYTTVKWTLLKIHNPTASCHGMGDHSKVVPEFRYYFEIIPMFLEFPRNMHKHAHMCNYAVTSTHTTRIMWLHRCRTLRRWSVLQCHALFYENWACSWTLDRQIDW